MYIYQLVMKTNFLSFPQFWSIGLVNLKLLISVKKPPLATHTSIAGEKTELTNHNYIYCLIHV